MKMNKLAAGALALALGLGAVAPAVAAETKDYSGAELFMEKYEAQLKEANKLRRVYLEKEAALELAKKNEADAKATVEALEKKLEALLGEKIKITTENGVEEAVKAAYNMKEQRVKDAYALVKDLSDSPAGQDYTSYLNEKRDRDELKAAAFKNWTPKEGKSADDLKVAINALVVALKDYDSTVEKKGEIWKVKEELVAAVAARNVAATKLADAQKAYDKAKKDYDEAYADLAKDAASYGFLVQVGNNGLKIVKDGEDKVKGPKKFNIKELKAAREKALQTLEAVKLLEELAPKKIADVKAELNKLVEEQKALIKLADKYLAKEMALVSTAYAAEDEEEMSPEELTNKLNEKSDKIQDLIKDKEEDKKPEEKPEEKPADKEEDKKPAEKPAKKSGNNARTGIAGVAGVAGILAAASVAYAASKRD